MGKRVKKRFYFLHFVFLCILHCICINAGETDPVSENSIPKQELAAFFESGEIIVTPQEPLPEITDDYSVVIPGNAIDQTFQGEDPETLRKRIIQAARESLIQDISPDGTAYLTFSPSEEIMMSVSEGKIAVLMFTDQRGVPGNEKKLERLQGLIKSGTLLTSDGCVWSPDNRYISMSAVLRGYMHSDYSMDPILMDTETGEIFFVEVYGSSPFGKKNDGVTAPAGFNASCCFSSDGRSFFYIMYLGRENSLMRYDLETGACKFCTFLPGNSYAWAGLTQIKDGSLVCLVDGGPRSEDHPSILRMRLEENRWITDQYTFPEIIPKIGARKSFAGGEPGYVFVPGNPYNYLMGASFSLIKTFRIYSDKKDLNQIWFYDIEGQKMVSMASVEYLTKTDSREAYEEFGKAASDEYGYLLMEALSPDGQYVFLLYSDLKEHSMHPVILSLETMETVPVNGIETEEIHIAAVTEYGRWRCEWNEKGILIGDSYDDLRLYRIGQ